LLLYPQLIELSGFDRISGVYKSQLENKHVEAANLDIKDINMTIAEDDSHLVFF